MKIQRTSFVLAVLLLLLASCAPVTQPPSSSSVPVTVEPVPTLVEGAPVTEADVPRVTVDEAAAAIQNSEAVVLDVRSAQAYQASHIPGALSIPLFDIESNPNGMNLDKDKWIITYCT